MRRWLAGVLLSVLFAGMWGCRSKQEPVEVKQPLSPNRFPREKAK